MGGVESSGALRRARGPPSTPPEDQVPDHPREAELAAELLHLGARYQLLGVWFQNRNPGI